MKQFCLKQIFFHILVYSIIVAVEEQFIILKHLLEDKEIPFNECDKLLNIIATCEISHADIVEMKGTALDLYGDYVGKGGIE